ncbi:hypothetical protein CDD82_1497 [Ophiocordyceps australis]|uniref:Secreted protein n=1 Tax=Ophiocordyceps australis TaxID=1399860 RepID=A0A2C5YJP1_9HYPO|nr:hypothetical protein CDD82_1497 [Ophiocordyceps australis]
MPSIERRACSLFLAFCLASPVDWSNSPRTQIRDVTRTGLTRPCRPGVDERLLAWQPRRRGQEDDDDDDDDDDGHGHDGHGHDDDGHDGHGHGHGGQMGSLIDASSSSPSLSRQLGRWELPLFAQQPPSVRAAAALPPKPATTRRPGPRPG